MSGSLFEQVLEDAFDALAEEVKALHQHAGAWPWQGQCNIRRGTHPLARLAAFIAGMPPAMQDAALHVDIHVQGAQEVWQRNFNGYRLRSVLGKNAQHLCERIGPVHFRFRLDCIDGALHWSCVGARLLGLVPLPARWFKDVRSREYAKEGRYHFEVDAQLPWIGRIICYQGWLLPAHSHQGH